MDDNAESEREHSMWFWLAVRWEGSIMKKCIALLLATAAFAVMTPESPAQLQLFGAKKNKTPPQQRVPELIVALKHEKDSHKRADAAEELRQFDLKDFPEIVPVLIDSLQSDPVANVRIEAATSLGRLRPISAEAGMALEASSANDPNLLVRGQATISLAYYKLCGYKAPKKNDTQGPDLKARADEPPLAGQGTTNGAAWWKSGSGPVNATGAVLTGPPDMYRPLPSGPTQNSQVPVTTVPIISPPGSGLGPVLQTIPPPQQPPPIASSFPIPDEGPKLSPPKL